MVPRDWREITEPAVSGRRQTRTGHGRCAVACFTSHVRTRGEGRMGRGKHGMIESTDNWRLLLPYHGALG